MHRIISLALGIVVLALAPGCADDHSTAPTPSQASGSVGSGPMMIPLPPSIRTAPLANYSATRWITTSSGGEIAVGGMRVRFPAGSVPSNMNVTVVVNTNEYVQVSLRPAGVSLRSPATIQLDDLSRTDGRAYLGGINFYLQASPNPIQQPTSNDWIRPQAWVLATGDFFLGGTRWDIPAMTPIRYLGGSGYVAKFVTAASGGTVVCDRVKVIIPAWSLRADTYITVRQVSEDGNLVAILEPHGIQFQSPVTVQINLTGLQWQPYHDWSLWWLNEATGDWEDQGGNFHNRTVTSQVSHFSRFTAGRAGW